MPVPMKYRAYFSCSLTSLSAEECNAIFRFGDKLEAVGRREGFEVYRPTQYTDTNPVEEITPEDIFERERAQILQSDVLIILLWGSPSMGVGVEASMAAEAGIPIILLHANDVKPGRILEGLSSLALKLEIEDNNVEASLQEAFRQILPFLKSSKDLKGRIDSTRIGERLRALRREQEVGLEELSDGTGIHEDRLKRIEREAPSLSNPSIRILVAIAEFFEVSLAELLGSTPGPKEGQKRKPQLDKLGPPEDPESGNLASPPETVRSPSKGELESFNPHLTFLSALHKERDSLLAELRGMEAVRERSVATPRESYAFQKDSEGSSLDLLVTCSGKSGNERARSVARDLIREYDLSAVVLFGIAAGIESRVEIADVLVSRQIWDLRKMEVSKEDYQFEPRSYDSPGGLALPFEPDNLRKQVGDRFAHAPTIHTDYLVGSTDNLIRSSDYMEGAARTHRKLGALEMEGAGVAEACQAHDTPFFVVRAISDHGTDEKNDSWHDLASALCAAVARFGFVENFAEDSR